MITNENELKLLKKIKFSRKKLTELDENYTINPKNFDLSKLSNQLNDLIKEYQALIEISK